MEKHMHLSKFLSLILRHKPEVVGINLDQDGWCSVDELIEAMQKKGKEINRAVLDEIVAIDHKQRYSIDDTGKKIRANQGHSINVNLDLKSLVPPEVLYHGTVEKYLDDILEKGLVKGQRQYVHLSKDLETARKVGSRRGQPIILKIDSQNMYKDGYKFYLSENKVWLCEFVPNQYISKMKL